MHTYMYIHIFIYIYIYIYTYVYTRVYIILINIHNNHITRCGRTWRSTTRRCWKSLLSALTLGTCCSLSLSLSFPLSFSRPSLDPPDGLPLDNVGSWPEALGASVFDLRGTRVEACERVRCTGSRRNIKMYIYIYICICI